MFKPTVIHPYHIIILSDGMEKTISNVTARRDIKNILLSKNSTNLKIFHVICFYLCHIFKIAKL